MSKEESVKDEAEASSVGDEGSQNDLNLSQGHDHDISSTNSHSHSQTYAPPLALPVPDTLQVLSPEKPTSEPIVSLADIETQSHATALTEPEAPVPFPPENEDEGSLKIEKEDSTATESYESYAADFDPAPEDLKSTQNQNERESTEIQTGKNLSISSTLAEVNTETPPSFLEVPEENLVQHLNPLTFRYFYR